MKNTQRRTGDGGHRGCRLRRESAARLRGLVRLVLCRKCARRVTAHGRDEGIVASEGFRRMNLDVTCAALVAAMQASPYPEVEIEPPRWRPAVRDFTL